MQTVKLAVVGAHLKDMPLHWQLTSRDAAFVGAFETAPTYRLYAMADSVPPKPALVHTGDGGGLPVEVYELERQSVVSGKSVSASGDSGGARNLIKKINNNQQ